MAPSGERSEEMPSLRLKSIELDVKLPRPRKGFYRLGIVLRDGSHCRSLVLRGKEGRNGRLAHFAPFPVRAHRLLMSAG